MRNRLIKFSSLLAALMLLAFGVSAQDDMMAPSVTVSDQVVVDGAVTVDSVVATEPGFIVIHADADGAPGPVIGNRLLAVGENTGVIVDIDAAAATSILYAMLHVDTGEAGVYEFPEVEGADSPVLVDGAPVTPAFNVAVLNANDGFLEEDAYTTASVTLDSPGWLVVHAEQDGSFGPVIGQTLIEAGTTADVAVALDPDGITDTLYPMLHIDDSEMGTYEFGSVEGADAPIAINGAVAVTSVDTFPSIDAQPQVVVHGDGMDMMGATFTADSVLAETDGWLVVHAGDAEGFGAVLGFTQVTAGLNTDVTVELEGDITPILWPMLHVDDNEPGTYEFPEVEGADGPVTVGEDVVTFPVNAAPFISYDGVTISEDGTTLTVSQALIGDAGWLVIHAEQDGSFGPVIGQTLLTPGLNTDVQVTVDTEGLTETVYPMLHVDDNELGLFQIKGKAERW